MLRLTRICGNLGRCAELPNRPIVHNEPLFPPELSDNNSPSFTSSISILVGDKSPVNKIPDDNEIEVFNVAEKQISKAVQVERINQSYVAKATKALNDPKNRKIDGSEQSSKDGRKAQSYKQSYNDQVTKVNHGSNQSRNSPNDTSILLIGDSIIKNIDPRKISRRRTVKICLPGKKAEQITAEVKSISVTNPSHVIIHSGTNNLPTDSEHECVKHAEDLVKCIKARFPVPKIALSGITIRRDIDVPAKIVEVNKKLQELCKKLGIYFINNDNLSETCLNGSQLHLNPKGTAYLATNVIRFIRGDNTKATTARRRDADFRISAPQHLVNTRRPAETNVNARTQSKRKEILTKSRFDPKSTYASKPDLFSPNNEHIISQETSPLKSNMTCDDPTMGECDSILHCVTKLKGLKIASLNVNSLLKHIDEIRHLLFKFPFDIFAINESTIVDSITDGEISTSGFNLIRKDRSRAGGGVALYIRESLSYIDRNDLVPDRLEMLCAEITRPFSKSLFVCTWYRPPNSDMNLFNECDVFLQKCESENKELIVVGDINCDVMNHHQMPTHNNLTFCPPFTNWTN